MAEFQQLSGKRGPQMRLWLDIPTRPAEIAQVRVWNRIVKKSVRKTLTFHLDEHMPRHFGLEARRRYKHKPRSEKYKAWKLRRFRSKTDLVLTGRTRAIVDSKSGPKISVGGAAEGGKKEISGRLSIPFGFAPDLREFYRAQKGKKSRDPNVLKRRGFTIRHTNPNRVTLRDMKAELQTMTPDEVEALQKLFADDLMQQIEKHKAGRKRIRG